MSFNLGELFPSQLLLDTVCERCVYLELKSQNQNNEQQIKNKYKLCLSNEIVNKTIGGKIFCSSCSNHEYFKRGKDHVSVTESDYEECYSETLKNNESIYIPKYVEFLSDHFLLAKRRDGFSFKYKAKIKTDKFAQIRKVVKRKIYDSDYVQNKSIVKLRKAIGLAPDISVLEKYGVKVDKTVLADW